MFRVYCLIFDWLVWIISCHSSDNNNHEHGFSSCGGQDIRGNDRSINCEPQKRAYCGHIGHIVDYCWDLPGKRFDSTNQVLCNKDH